MLYRRITQHALAIFALLLSATTDLAFAGEDNDDSQCGMYIAISSTSTVEDTKWGLYAGKDYEKNAPLGYPDIAINMFNLQGNAHLADDEGESLIGKIRLHGIRYFLLINHN